MNTVAELVEEGDDLVVLEQRGLLGRWLAEVADERSGRVASRSVGLDVARREVEVGRCKSQ